MKMHRKAELKFKRQCMVVKLPHYFFAFRCNPVSLMSAVKNNFLNAKKTEDFIAFVL